MLPKITNLLTIFCLILNYFFINSTLAADRCGAVVPRSAIECNRSTYTNGPISYKADGLTLNAEEITVIDTDFSENTPSIHLDQTMSVNTGNLAINANNIVLQTGNSNNIGTSSTNTQGRISDGIRASNGGLGEAEINVTGTNTNITTYGWNSSGLFGGTNNNSNDSNATIKFSDGKILTFGGSSHGLYALTEGLGEALVEYRGTGKISTNGSNAFAVYVLAEGDGDATSNVPGDGEIVTAGSSARAIRVRARGDGNANLTVGDAIFGTGPSITTMADFSTGVWAQAEGNGDGRVTIYGSTKISTAGGRSHGVLVGDNSNRNAGSSSIEMNDGTIKTDGIRSSGLLIDNSRDADGALITLNGGTIDVDAINSAAASDDGLSLTRGIHILHRGQNDAETIQNGGSIIVNDNIITFGPTQTSSFGQSAGIRVSARGQSNGNALATQNGGSITTFGDDVYGMQALSEGASSADAIARQGSGGTDPTATITTNGDRAHAIFAQVTNANDNHAMAQQTGTGRLITSGNGANGIFALAEGDGNATAQQTGTGTIMTSGSETSGLRAITIGDGEAAAQQIGDADVISSGIGSNGIQAVGSSGVIVDISGNVMGGRTGTDSIFKVGDELGSGIHASAGELNLSASTFSDNNNAVEIRLNNGSVVGAFSDHAIDVDGGVATIISDGTVTGFVTTFDNDDSFTNLSSNSFNARHFEDTDGDLIRDTEAVAVNDFGAGEDSFDNAATGILRVMTVPDQSGLTLDTSDDRAPTAWDTTGEYSPNDITVMTRSMQFASVEQVHFLNLETFTNTGIITLQDAQSGGTQPVWGDILLISGGSTPGTSGGGIFVTNGGSLYIDTHLNEGGSNSKSDLLVVDQTQKGSDTNSIFVANAGGLGGNTDLNDNNKVDTGEGILVVEVLDTENSASDAFTLGTSVAAGAYNYGLHFDPNGGDWYLTTDGFNQTTAVYENLPNAMLVLNGLPTLRQRVGNRYWQKQNSVASSVNHDVSPNLPKLAGNTQSPFHAFAIGEHDIVNEDSMVWVRFDSAYSSIKPGYSSTDSTYDAKYWKLQAGIDRPVVDNDQGKLIVGANISYGVSSLDIDADFSVGATQTSGAIDTKGYALGMPLTWIGNDDFYVDAQAQLALYDNEMSVNGVMEDLGDANGVGYAMSYEIGKRFAISDALTINPQAQLVYSSVKFDSFSGPFNEDVSLEDGDSLKNRLGIALEHTNTWLADNETTSRTSVYGIANIYYEFLNDTSVDVSGINFSSDSDSVFGGVGLGNTFNWLNGKYSIFGEVHASSSLTSPGNSYSIGGNIGFRVNW